MRQIAKSAWLLAAVSGLLQVVIFPSIDWSFLCWIAYAPLLVAVARARQSDVSEALLPATGWQGFLLGWLSGVIWSAGVCFWIFYVMHYYGGLGNLSAAVVLVLFCLLIGLHHGLFGAMLGWASRKGSASEKTARRMLLLAPFFWVAVEIFRAKFLQFPWALLGTVQVDNIPLTRIATVTGVYGLSLEIMLVNTVFAAAWLAPRGRRRGLIAAAVAASVLVQSTVLLPPPPSSAPETARLVQMNAPIFEAGGWTEQEFLKLLNEIEEKSIPTPDQAMGAPPPSVIIWPETPAPLFLSDAYLAARIKAVAQKAAVPVIFGAIGYPERVQEDTPPEFIFNSAAAMMPDGRIAGRYDKNRLVPFGEFVPFSWALRWADKLTREVGDYKPGTTRNVFQLDRYSAGVFICYESIFPGEIREFAANGADVFVNISNDGWFGPYGALHQHLDQARMRAIENRRWVLRATNTGITASIDPYGRVVETADVNTRTYLDAPFSVVKGTTFYTRHGDWFAYLCAIISVLALLFLRLRPRKTV